MKVKNLLIKTASVLLLFFLIGCEGDEGPQGPKGDTGANGEVGPMGATGATGTANVKFTDWLSVEPSSLLPTAKVGAFSNGIITSKDLDEGVVLVYGQASRDTNLKVLLPFTFHNRDVTPNYAISTEIIFKSGGFEMHENYLTPGTPNAVWAATKTFFINKIRIVIIPGGVKARVKGLDYSNYDAVKAHYGLED